MEHENHHYIPQFYLRSFSPDNKIGMIWVYDGIENKPLLKSIKRHVACLKDFYMIKGVDGDDKNEFENHLEKVETKVARIYNKLSQNDFILSHEEKEYLFYFISLMHIRIPAFRDGIIKYETQLAEAIIEPYTKDEKLFYSAIEKIERKTGKKLNADFKNFKNANENKRIPFSLKQNYLLSTIINLSKEVFKYISIMKWSYLRANDKLEFITSDRPVTLGANGWDVKLRFPPGLGQKNVKVFFPISKDLCMIGKYDGGETILKAEVEMVNFINLFQTSRWAYKYLYSSSKNILDERRNNINQMELK